LAAAGATNWYIYGIYGELDCPIASIMRHIGACVVVCAEITGIGDLDCVSFLDVTGPVALTEAIGEGPHGGGSSYGLGKHPEVVFGELILMPASS
jgi:hypothetical protein